MIRKAILDDVDRILDLLNSDPNLVGGPGEGYKYKKKHIIDFVENPIFKTFVYEVEGKIVGVIQTEFWEASKYVQLNDIIIDEDYRKKGIGFELQNYIEKLANEQGYEFLYLYSEEDNSNAHKMLKKGGYEKGKKFVFFSKVLK